MLQATEEIDPFERYWLFVWKLVACMVRWIYFASGLLNQCQNVWAIYGFWMYEFTYLCDYT